jgi:dihydroflavonol-4-reductase
MPYGHSKYLAEVEVQKAVLDGLDAVIVNPSVVLGARDINLISGSIIVEASRGLARFYPPGGVNYIAVEDVVAGHIAAAERGRVGERYILANENINYKEAFNIICDLVGRPRPKLGLPRWSLPVISTAVSGARLLLGTRVPMDANQVKLSGAMIYADSRKAIQELSLPQTPFVLAVKNTYDWYNDNGYL